MALAAFDSGATLKSMSLGVPPLARRIFRSISILGMCHRLSQLPVAFNRNGCGGSLMYGRFVFAYSDFAFFLSSFQHYSNLMCHSDLHGELISELW
jgi:hypothetical protein